MDRNSAVMRQNPGEHVALRKESVDRNVPTLSCTIGPPLSLSARRAWIEIYFWHCCSSQSRVALRKESVDRNTSIDNITKGIFESLSARRAWIEMVLARSWFIASCRRSPQGERG